MDRMEMVMAALPELVRVIVWAALVAPTAWLAKVRLAGDKLAAGALAVAVPEKVTDCGLPVALSAMLRVVVLAPAAEGLNMTWTKQLAPAASAPPQLLVWVKSLALAPVSMIEVMVKGELPELVTKRFSGPPVVPTALYPK